MTRDIKEIEQLVFASKNTTKDEKQSIFDLRFKTWRKDHEYIYKRFNIDFKSKILDIGSSYGGNLINFSEDSVGVEASAKVAGFAKHMGLNIVSINAEDSLHLINQKFDLIWCTDFLVHMISPYKFLYDTRALLNSSGRVVIQIPLMSVFNTHRSTCHFYAFNKKALMYLMEMAGYKVIKTSGYVRRLPNWLNFIFEPLLQLFGGNIWILAERGEKTPVNLNKVFPPAWFNF